MSSKRFFSALALALFFCHAAPVFAADREALKKGAALNDSAIRKMRAHDLDGAEQDLLQAQVYSNENPQISKNLSVVYYEKGVRFQGQRNYRDAQRYLKQALEMRPDDPKYKKAFAAALFVEATDRSRQGQEEQALALFQKAAVYDPSNLTIVVQAAHSAWKTQNLDLAHDYLEKARTLNPSDANIAVLERQLETSEGEKDYETQSSEHFIFSANATMMTNSAQFLSDLEKAYNTVCYKLSFYPKAKIPVIMYPVHEFRDHWRMPQRVAGYYDGKLRIPYPNASTTPAALQPIIMHELTHAFIRSITQKRIPQWLNEGLAQWVEGKVLEPKAKDALVIYQISRRMPDIAHLDRALGEQGNPFNNTEMTLAYMKSFSMVEYLIERHGVWTLMKFIESYDDSIIFDTQFKEYFKMSVKDAEADWVRWIERK